MLFCFEAAVNDTTLTMVLHVFFFSCNLGPPTIPQLGLFVLNRIS